MQHVGAFSGASETAVSLHGVQRSQDLFLAKATESRMAMTTLAHLSQQGQGTEILTTHMGWVLGHLFKIRSFSMGGERKETTLA